MPLLDLAKLYTFLRTLHLSKWFVVAVPQFFRRGVKERNDRGGGEYFKHNNQTNISQGRI